MMWPKTKRVTYYKCPVCGMNSTDRETVQRHFRQHTIQAEEVVYCNICGQGWYVGAWGEHGAIERAEACQKKHQKEGNTEDVAARTFFLSGGTFGFPTIKKGGKSDDRP